MGDPHLRLGAFSLSIVGREFPDLDDYWDGNWLVAEARFGQPPRVTMRGPFLHADEIATFAERVRRLAAASLDEARFDCTEPNLALAMTCGAAGRVRVDIDMRPDPGHELHAFAMELDRSCLPPLCTDLEAILAAYPVRQGEPG